MSTAEERDLSESPQEFEQGLRLIDPHFAEERFPWRQVIGFAASLALTFAALLLVRRGLLAPQGITAVLFALAALQAGIQLGVFMHLRESRGPAFHVPLLALGIAIAVGMVGMSVWIMTFKWGVS